MCNAAAAVLFIAFVSPSNVAPVQRISPRRASPKVAEEDSFIGEWSDDEEEEEMEEEAESEVSTVSHYNNVTPWYCWLSGYP